MADISQLEAGTRVRTDAGAGNAGIVTSVDAESGMVDIQWDGYDDVEAIPAGDVELFPPE